MSDFAVPDAVVPDSDLFLAHLHTKATLCGSSVSTPSNVRAAAKEAGTSSKLADALDVSKEDPLVRAKYGDGKPYQFQYDGAPTCNDHLLMARRLVEAGVRCVTLTFGRWDSHGQNFQLVRDHGGKLDQADGIATIVDTTTNAKLVVTFDNFFARLVGPSREGNYWIIDLDPDYQTALVGTPDRRYLWILSRTAHLLDEVTYQRFVAKSQQLGFPVADLIQAKRDSSM